MGFLPPNLDAWTADVGSRAGDDSNNGIEGGRRSLPGQSGNGFV